VAVTYCNFFILIYASCSGRPGVKQGKM